MVRCSSSLCKRCSIYIWPAFAYRLQQGTSIHHFILLDSANAGGMAKSSLGFWDFLGLFLKYLWFAIGWSSRCDTCRHGLLSAKLKLGAGWWRGGQIEQSSDDWRSASVSGGRPVWGACRQSWRNEGVSKGVKEVRAQPGGEKSRAERAAQRSPWGGNCSAARSEAVNTGCPFWEAGLAAYGRHK